MQATHNRFGCVNFCDYLFQYYTGLIDWLEKIFTFYTSLNFESSLTADETIERINSHALLF